MQKDQSKISKINDKQNYIFSEYLSIKEILKSVQIVKYLN